MTSASRTHRHIHSSRRPLSSPTHRRLFLETLENRSLLAGFVGIPNDSDFAQQWMLNNTGQTGGVVDADIDGLEAWSVSTGSMATVVAVLDSGVDFTDPDLYQNIWLNAGEIPASIRPYLIDSDSDGLITFRDLNSPANSSFVVDLNANGYIDGGDLLADPNWENGLDEDGNGRTDDLVGWDFHDNDNDPRPEVSGGVYQSHGTDQAKMIGAVGNNGIGTAGINWSVRLIPVRIREAALVINNISAAAGLDYAVASGAPISNNSWRTAGGGYVYSQEMYDAIDRAQQAGHLFIAGAGNDGTDNDTSPLYPASYNLDNMISATVVDASNQAPTNYGQTTVDLGSSSPGGSSGASSHTSGVAALLKSVHPDWTYAQIKNRILSTVDPLPSLAGKTVTGGRLNAASALGYVPPATKFYVADDGSANKTFEYDASGSEIENYAVNSGNTAPRGAASNVAGDRVWVVDDNRNVYVYNTSGGLLGSWAAGSLNASAQPEGIATNGTDVWIVDNKTDKVFKYAGAASRLSGSQNAAGSFSLNNSNTSPKDLVTDGTSLWVVNDSSTDKVFKYTVGGSLLGSWTITGAGSSPTGITLDPGSPSHLWIVDSGTDRVYQFDNAVSRTSGSQSPSTSFALAAGNTNPQGIADPPVVAGGGAAAYDAALLSLFEEYLASGQRKRRP